MRFMLWFRREQLDLLAPAGVSVADTWLVCFGHRSQVDTITGRPVLGGVDAWHPMIPCATQGLAEAFAERFARASLDEGDTLGWEPVVDDHGRETAARELWVTHADGSESQADVAIAPLGMLAYD